MNWFTGTFTVGLQNLSREQGSELLTTPHLAPGLGFLHTVRQLSVTAVTTSVPAPTCRRRSHAVGPTWLDLRNFVYFSVSSWKCRAGERESAKNIDYSQKTLYRTRKLMVLLVRILNACLTHFRCSCQDDTFMTKFFNMTGTAEVLFCVFYQERHSIVHWSKKITRQSHDILKPTHKISAS